MQHAATSRGTAYGFEVHSALPFRHLRNGEGDPLHVVAAEINERPGGGDKLLAEWKPPANSMTARLYSNGHRYLLWIAGSGWFSIDPAARQIVVPPHKDPARIEERLWGIPALLCFIARGDHALHAAAVEVNGSAVLIAGSRKLGRDAIAAAFAANGNRVLSQDLSCLRFGMATGLVPGPALLRVGRDDMSGVDMSSGNGTWMEERDSFSLDATRRGSCKPIPVRSVVLLEASDETRALVPMEAAQAISDLWSMSFRLPTEDDRGRCFEGVATLAGTVPVFKLQRGAHEDPQTLIDRIGSTSLEYA